MEALGLPVPALAVVAFGGWSVALLCCVLVLRGKLIPEAQVTREVTQARAETEAARAETAIWRSAAETSGLQSKQMLEGQETMLQLLRGLTDRAPQ